MRIPRLLLMSFVTEIFGGVVSDIIGVFPHQSPYFIGGVVFGVMFSLVLIWELCGVGVMLTRGLVKIFESGD